MYVRWPQNPPFLIPPATPKVPLAPDGAVIHPPPVMKSLLESQAGAGQLWMSACADEMTTSATPGNTTCSAFTVMSPSPVVSCSLMTTFPPAGNGIVSFGVPATTMDCPLI